MAASLVTPRLFAGERARRGDLKITRIVGFELRSKRNKLAGKNARLDVHGDSASDPMIRIYTNAEGVEGLGVCRAPRERIAELIGKDPFSFLDRTAKRVRSPLGSQNMALWDVIGRFEKKPVCELIGAASIGSERRVKMYDGSIYFADLLPEHEKAWQDRFKKEIDMGLAMGHRGFKVKVGRGSKWMERAAGDARDIEVIHVIRQHAGKDVLIGVDANNGYDLEGAKRFVDATSEAKLAFTEEMFPEVVDQCLALKAFFREKKLDTLLADGETNEIDAFQPFVNAKAIDVFQADMNRFGVDGILGEADMARPQGLRIAPHNWGSLIGFYQQLQIGAAIDNFYCAENDPLSSDLLVADGFVMKDGAITVPNASGFGLRLNEEKFGEVKVGFELK
jgi:L-alanine-DL-glutamate epimerase-like enolase superfamily enzyme